MQIISHCYENFRQMSKHKDGRYCRSCEKVVVDFTQMSRAELNEYFEKHKGNDICGRAKNSQLEKQNRYEVFLLEAGQRIKKKVNIKPLRGALLAAISGLLTFTTSCMGKMMPPAEQFHSPIQDTISGNPKSVPGKKK